MKRGRKPTPTAVLKLRGSWRANRPGEPTPDTGDVSRPKGMSPAERAEWDRIAPTAIKLGLLTEYDVGTFRRLCEFRARYRRERDELSVFQLTNLNTAICKLEALFGIGPQERARLAIPKREQPKDSKKRFFGS